MSKGDFAENIFQDTIHFANTFCDFFKAFPNENQHIFGQIYEQIQKADRHKKDYIPSEKGQEEIWIFERRGVRVYKRVFHPGPGEGPVGVDFVLYKMKSPSKVGATAVQVKRNKNKPFFEFARRDLDQLDKLAQSWRSAYYLMVDETSQPPLHCFLTVNELYNLIGPNKKSYVRIPNTGIRKYCRGSNLFYDLFFRCNRGSLYFPEEYSMQVINYASQTKRVVVEISTKKGDNHKALKTENNGDFPRSENGRIKGFIDSL